MDEKQEELLKKLKETDESEKEKQEGEDGKKLKDVLTGRTELYVDGFGTIIFEQPDAGLIMDGDQIAAKFKTHHLRKGDLLLLV